ncbi:MAG: hypothetical protein OK452_02095 [Thaumarchaeota archaeon]|nr:hypothetical protein [Nitrososphaerota archaeon]
MVLIILAGVVVAVVGLLVVPSPYQLSIAAPGALTLSGSLNSTLVMQNQTVRVTVTDRNGLPLVNELPFSGDWRAKNLSMGPCSSVPFGIAVYFGRYTMGNISSATSVEIYAPGGYFCPLMRVTNSFRFEPFQSMAEYVDLRGYWTQGLTTHPGGGVSEGVLHPFLPGIYTVTAGDEWGHIQIAYFEVRGIGLQDFSLCSSNCGYPSPYLSGLIYFDAAAPVKSLQLFVNGTDQGVDVWSGNYLTRFAEWYKGGFQNPAVVKGDAYALRFVAIFQDNSTATVATTVVAG